MFRFPSSHLTLRCRPSVILQPCPASSKNRKYGHSMRERAIEPRERANTSTDQQSEASPKRSTQTRSLLLDVATHSTPDLQPSVKRKGKPHPNLYEFKSESAPSYFFQDAPENVRKRRSATMTRLTRVIKEKFGSEYEVQPFGSTRYGVSSSEADMDMVIIDPSRPHGISPDDKRKQPAIYDVRRVADTLRRAGFTQIKSIPRASVPIVQFRDPLTSLDCDININERLGIFNSDLINAYCSNMVTLRPLLFSIKTWAKSKGLNSSNPPSGELRSFSSYALTMMTIGFLQHRGYLPNLQAHLPPLEASGYNMNFWRTRPRPTCCDCRFYTKPPSWKQPPHLPNQQGLLRDWFQFWAHEFKYNTQMVSIREGGIVERRDTNDVSNLVLTTSIPLSGPPFLSIPIRVMDPFIVEKNVACSVSARAMERFARECGEWTRNGQ